VGTNRQQEGKDRAPEHEGARAPDRDELERMVASADRRRRASPTERPTSAPLANDDAFAAVLGAIDGMAEARAELERRRDDRRVELKRFREESRARSVELAAGAADRLAVEIKGHRDLFDAVAPDPGGVAPWVPETTPVMFIRSTPGGSLRDSQVDGDTWAKWESSSSADAITHKATERLSFYHLWQNPRRRTQLVDVSVGMTIRGHADCEAHGMGVPSSWFWDDTRSDVDVSARLTVWPLWVPEASEQMHAVPLASIHARAGAFSDSESASISTNVFLHTARYAVLGDAYILIEASLVADFSAYDGEGSVDMAAGSFRVDCPYCVVVVPA